MAHHPHVGEVLDGAYAFSPAEQEVMEAAFEAASHIEGAELLHLADGMVNTPQNLWPAQNSHSNSQVRLLTEHRTFNDPSAVVRLPQIDSVPFQDAARSHTAWNVPRPNSHPFGLVPPTSDIHHAHHVAPPHHFPSAPAHSPSRSHLPQAPRSHPYVATHHGAPSGNRPHAHPAPASHHDRRFSMAISQPVRTSHPSEPMLQVPSQVQYSPVIASAVVGKNRHAHAASHFHTQAHPSASVAVTPLKRARAESQSDVTTNMGNKAATPPSRKRLTASAAECGRKGGGNKENAGASNLVGAAPSPTKGLVDRGAYGGEGEEDEEDVDPEEELGDPMKDSDVDGEDGEDGAPVAARRAKWLQADRTRLYEYILGADADEVFALLQVDRKCVFKKAVATLAFTGVYTPNAAEKHYTRAVQTYRLIVTAMGTTGGAGDIDSNTDSQATLRKLSSKLTKARQEGRNVGKLSARTWEQWRSIGWFEMFHARYSGDARMARAVERNSATPAAARNTSPAKSATDEADMSQRVSEPRHPGPKSKPGTPLGAEKLHDILKQKIQSDHEDRQVRQAEATERIKISRERLELDKKAQENRFRLEVLKAAEGSNVLTDETKGKMNEWVQNHFM